MALRRHRDEHAAAIRYQMRQKLIAIGDDYWIEDEEGHRAFRVNGKAVRFRDTFILEDPGGGEVAKIQERKLSVRDTYGVEVAPGEDDALVLAITVCIDAMAHPRD